MDDFSCTPITYFESLKRSQALQGALVASFVPGQQHLLLTRPVPHVGGRGCHGSCGGCPSAAFVVAQTDFKLVPPSL